MDADGRYGYIQVGADTVTPFKIYGEVKVTARRGSKTLTFDTGHKEYNNSVLQIIPYINLVTTTKEMFMFGFTQYLSYNKSSGIVTYSMLDEANAIYGFWDEIVYTLKYVLW